MVSVTGVSGDFFSEEEGAVDGSTEVEAEEGVLGGALKVVLEETTTWSAIFPIAMSFFAIFEVNGVVVGF